MQYSGNEERNKRIKFTWCDFCFSPIYNMYRDSLFILLVK